MSRPRLDLVGKKFGRLYVLAFSHTDKYGGGGFKSFWRCRCDCGNFITCWGSKLITGQPKSCGCLNDATQYSKHPLYHIWYGMKSRCYSKSEPSFKWYGARGISVCDSWLSDFKQFCKDVGPRPGPKYSIDRIDNNGNYAPGNVRWATYKTQANNTSRNAKITFDGITMTTAEWSNLIGFKEGVIRQRLKYGWSIEKALTSKLMTYKERASCRWPNLNHL